MIEEKQEQELAGSGNDLIAQANQMKVWDAETYAEAGDWLKGIKEYKKQVNSVFDGPIKSANATHKMLTIKRKEHLAPAEEADKTVRRVMLDWKRCEDARQDAIRREAEAEARRQDEERKIAEAAQLEKEGFAEKAEAVIDQPAFVPPVQIKETPKVQGVYTRKVWDFEVIDPNLVPRRWLIVNEKVIRSYVKATKGVDEIPGVKIFCKEEMAVR